jgi:hypothetical protein
MNQMQRKRTRTRRWVLQGVRMKIHTSVFFQTPPLMTTLILDSVRWKVDCRKGLQPAQVNFKIFDRGLSETLRPNTLTWA